MKHYRIILPLAAALLVAACGGETALPDPTGKASVRAISSLQRAGVVEFLIEERTLGTVGFRGVTTTSSYDDFTYNFNFDVRYAGDNEDTRIASTTIDFVSGQDYTLLLHGTLATPAITVWETAERTFDDGGTLFQARFAHTSDLLGAETIDVYFTEEGVTPVAGEQKATLAFGEISAAMDFETGAYIITITTAGDFADVLYTSEARTVLAGSNLIITPFDGSENTTSPIIVRALGTNGTGFPMPDPTYGPVIQFLHAATDAGSLDIYNDEMLTSLIVDDLAYQQLTPEQPLAIGENNFTFTPFDSTGTIVQQASLEGLAGARYRMSLVGLTGGYSAPTVLPDREPADTSAKVYFRQVANNFDFLNVYVMESGEVPTEDAFPTISALSRNTGIQTLNLGPGSYDFYVSEAGVAELAIIAGPVSADLAYGDVVDYFVFDNVADPAIVDLVELVETP